MTRRGFVKALASVPVAVVGVAAAPAPAPKPRVEAWGVGDFEVVGPFLPAGEPEGHRAFLRVVPKPGFDLPRDWVERDALARRLLPALVAGFHTADTTYAYERATWVDEDGRIFIRCATRASWQFEAWLRVPRRA